jgi:predicted dehydrogenase
MRDAATERPGQVVQIVPSPFSLHVDPTVKRLIGEGYLGDLLAIDVYASSGAFLDRESPLHWRQDTELSGLNVLSLGIWYEALLRWVGEATSVTAMGKTYVTSRREPDGGAEKPVRIPEHLAVTADMACGALATFVLSAVGGHVERQEALLFGSEGTLQFRNGTLFGGRRDEAGLTEIAIPPEERGGWRVEEEFVRAIRGEEQITRTAVEDGVRYMEFTEAVDRSRREGCAVGLPLAAS